MLRKPCVAGKFYPAEGRELSKNIREYLASAAAAREKAVAVIAPHAGYIYSGHVAGAVYSSVEIPDDVILIGPNHTGLGEGASVMATGSWEMPLGKVDINEELASAVLSSSSLFKEDTAAHLMEHSLEVQLPFLFEINRNVRIVPVTLLRASAGDCVIMGEAIASAVSSYGKKVLIIVSSDMNHYEADKKTRQKDRLAIDKIISLDAKGLLEVTSSMDITMCGVIPAAVAIAAAKSLGAVEARLVKYATSGDTSGDYSHVVGYAGILIK